MKRILILLLLMSVVLLGACSGDFRNKVSRKGVEYLDGDYRVVFAADGHVKEWIIDDDKVTTISEKGYYFFWATDSNGKRHYVQTPIDRTYIEAVDL